MSTAMTSVMPPKDQRDLEKGRDIIEQMQQEGLPFGVSIDNRALANYQQTHQRRAGAMVDASTQVYSRSRAQPTSSTLQGANLGGGHEVADHGVCNYRVCFSRGCGRGFTRDHYVKPEAEQDADDFMRNICPDCEDRANRAFWITLIVSIGIVILAIFPFLLSTGTATHASSVTAV